jgi:hypothetical protein
MDELRPEQREYQYVESSLLYERIEAGLLCGIRQVRDFGPITKHCASFVE